MTGEMIGDGVTQAFWMVMGHIEKKSRNMRRRLKYGVTCSEFMIHTQWF